MRSADSDSLSPFQARRTEPQRCSVLILGLDTPGGRAEDDGRTLALTISAAPILCGAYTLLP